MDAGSPPGAAWGRLVKAGEKDSCVIICRQISLFGTSQFGTNMEDQTI
jgi:hypothetical protein